MNILSKIFLLIIVSSNLIASNLKEILEMTIENNRNIKSLNYNLASKREDLKSSSNIYNPTLNLGGSYTKLDFNIPKNGVGATQVGFIKFKIDLYDGGKNRYIKKEKYFELQKAKFDKISSIREILLEVITTFFNIKTLEENIKAYQEKSKALNSEYLKKKQKYDLKMVTKDEVLKLKSELEANRYLIEELKYQKVQLLENLTLLVGKRVTFLDNSELPDFNNLVYKESSSIKSLENNIRVISENIKEIDTIKKPKIELENSLNIYNYNNYNQKLLKDLPDIQNRFMLNFTLNLYNSSTSYKRESLILSKLSKQENIKYFREKERILFKLSKKRVSTQKIKIKSAQMALNMANSLYQIILAKYQNGLVDNITYLDALSKKTINQALLNQALNEYQIAKADYYFNSGLSIEEFIKRLK